MFEILAFFPMGKATFQFQRAADADEQFNLMVNDTRVEVVVLYGPEGLINSFGRGPHERTAAES